MSHATCTHGNQVDSRHFVVGSQIVSLTPGLSFCHNLCYRCLNGSCEPILDIYNSIAFQQYKELFNARCFDLYNHSLKVRESNSQYGSSLGSVSLHPHTLSHSSWPAPLQAFALVASPRLGLQHRMKQWKKKVGACSLTHNISGVGGHVGASRWD